MATVAVSCKSSASPSVLQPPRLNFVNPKQLWLDLKDTLQVYQSDVLREAPEPRNHLSWKAMRAMQMLNTQQCLQRNDMRAVSELRRRNADAECDPEIVIEGAPLHDIVMHASAAFAAGGATHDIPIVVHSCVEALLRRGIYQSGLFRTLPNKRRRLELLDTFNDGPSFGEGFSLQNESIPDICALLVGFLNSLPHPLVDPALYDALWSWCLLPTERRHEMTTQELADKANEGTILPSGQEVLRSVGYNSKASIVGEEESKSIKEMSQVAAASILLKFLPAANLSLLVYLFGFFNQLPLCPENGLQPDDITRIFAHPIIGGDSKQDAMKLMLWLLERWPKISEVMYARSTADWDRRIKEHASQSPRVKPIHESTHSRKAAVSKERQLLTRPKVSHVCRRKREFLERIDKWNAAVRRETSLLSPHTAEEPRPSVSDIRADSAGPSAPPPSLVIGNATETTFFDSMVIPAIKPHVQSCGIKLYALGLPKTIKVADEVQKYWISEQNRAVARRRLEQGQPI